MKLTSSQLEAMEHLRECQSLELAFKPVDLRTDSVNMLIADILAMPQKLAQEPSVQPQVQELELVVD